MPERDDTPKFPIDDKGNTGVAAFGTTLIFVDGIGFVRRVAGVGGRAGRFNDEIITTFAGVAVVPELLMGADNEVLLSPIDNETLLGE